MTKINWKVRFNNPTYYAQLILAILTPALAYLGLEFADLDTWGAVGKVIVEAYSNPYLLGLIVISVVIASTDPTVRGVGDSTQALTYKRPRKNKGGDK